MSITTTVISYIIAASVWATPMPKHVNGLLVLYGGENLAKANAIYHGYNLDPYKCGLAVMSPGDLGKIVWVRATGGEWFGPCLAVDISAWKDFYANVYVRHEIAEVDIRAANALGFTHGVHGEAYVGVCPPADSESTSQNYKPTMKMVKYNEGDTAPLSLFWPYPEQQMPVNCFSKVTGYLVHPLKPAVADRTGLPEDGICNNRYYSCRFIKQPDRKPTYDIPNQGPQVAFSRAQYP